MPTEENKAVMRREFEEIFSGGGNIEIENNLHREWFDRPENAYMFRPAFREYIAKNFPKPAPAPVAAAS
jgi:hypothetical protein